MYRRSLSIECPVRGNGVKLSPHYNYIIIEAPNEITVMKWMLLGSSWFWYSRGWLPLVLNMIFKELMLQALCSIWGRRKYMSSILCSNLRLFTGNYQMVRNCKHRSMFTRPNSSLQHQKNQKHNLCIIDWGYNINEIALTYNNASAVFRWFFTMNYQFLASNNFFSTSLTKKAGPRHKLINWAHQGTRCELCSQHAWRLHW